MSEPTFIFAGNEVNLAEYTRCKEAAVRNECPYCGGWFSPKFHGYGRHIMACKENPRNKDAGGETKI